MKNGKSNQIGYDDRGILRGFAAFLNLFARPH